MIDELHRWVSWLGFVLGWTYFITASLLFAPVRIVLARQGTFWRGLVYCPACCATWFGFATACAHRWPGTVIGAGDGWLSVWNLAGGTCSAMALGLVWGAVIKFCSGDVYAREAKLIFPPVHDEGAGVAARACDTFNADAGIEDANGHESDICQTCGWVRGYHAP